jgi:pyruvate formate lyase activating enzyme
MVEQTAERWRDKRMAENIRDASVVTEEELRQIDVTDLAHLEANNMLVEVLLQEPLGNNRSQCHVCLRRCKIPLGKAGFCQTKVNVGGKIYTTIYGVVSSAAVDPIEKKPVFHYKPGSLVYSIGSLGCNFRCAFCQNWEIAYADGTSCGGLCEPNLTPEQAIKATQDSGSEGIAWTYNEPGIWLEYTLDCAKLAKKAGLYTVYVTNGYSTPEHLDLIGPYLDVYRVDLKSMSDEFYRKLIRVPHVSEILEVARMAKEKFNMHIECVTNIVPGWNDDDDNTIKTASWIKDNLGELTPWHITRFYPHADLSNVPPTPPETLDRAVELAKEIGLKFVYLGNIQTSKGENTYCPEGGELLVERHGYQTKVRDLTPEGRCRRHGADINITM